jgi:D-alanyl-D-alanine carboxypeptidase
MKKVFSILIMVLLLCNHTTGSASTLDIKSEAAILIDSQSGAVLYEKNAKQKMYPASLTKIATAIYAIERGNLANMVTITKEATEVDGTKVYLNEGEEVPLKKLIQGMLINSGNDAAEAIALHLDGNREAFSRHLNDFLQNKINVQNTHFTNPHGLFEGSHYTTAEDLAKITSYALQNDTFKEIYGTKELKLVGESWDTTIFTHHRMLKGEIPLEGIIGGKTGFVTEAKQTLATSAENEKISLTAIVLKADHKKGIYQDTQLLLEYGFARFQTSLLEPSEVKHNKYYLPNETFITEDLQEGRQTVLDNGELLIETGSDETIQTIQLEKHEREPVESKVEQTKQEHEEDHATVIYGAAVFVLAGLLVGMKNKIFKYLRR